MIFHDPAALFHSALAALNAEEWRVAADHCDPVSLRAFERQMVSQFAPPPPEYELTPELLMRYEPDMPRAAAEYQVAQHRKHADPTVRLRHELPGMQSIAHVSTVDPVTLFASWLQGRSPRAQILRLIELGHAPAAAAPLASVVPTHRYYDFTVLGTVPDGEMAAHVVYRDQADETTPWSGEVAAHLATLPIDEQRLIRFVSARGHARLAFCRRQEDSSWRLIADHRFMGVASRGISSVGAEPAASSPDAS